MSNSLSVEQLNALPNKAEAIRSIANQLEAEAQVVKPATVMQLYNQTKWATDDWKDRNYIASILSVDRAKQGRRRVKAAEVKPPLPEELLTVKSAAEQNWGSLENLNKELARIETLAAGVGGLYRLKMCLEFWKKIKPKKSGKAVK